VIKQRMDDIYLRSGERTWRRKASKSGWGFLEAMIPMLRAWQKKAKNRPSPYLVCRKCGDVVLDPATNRVRSLDCDMRDAVDESFARIPCRGCVAIARKKRDHVA
jgi:hypothetical protein